MDGGGTRSGQAVLVVAALVVNGMLVGASLDQAVKQLPARHRMGVDAFAAYSAAADLANGVGWYAGLGLSAAALAVGAVLALRRDARGREHALLLAVLLATVGWLVVTAFAAPLNFSQLDAAGDPVALGRIFNRFAALNTLRAGLQALVVAALAGAVARRLSTAATAVAAVRPGIRR